MPIKPHYVTVHREDVYGDVVRTCHRTFDGARQSAAKQNRGGVSPIGVWRVSRPYRPGERVDVIAEQNILKGEFLAHGNGGSFLTGRLVLAKRK